MKVRIKKISPDAKTPIKKNNDDFCYDVFATSDAEPVYDEDGKLIPDVWCYHTGLVFELVRDEYDLTKYEEEEKKNGEEEDGKNDDTDLLPLMPISPSKELEKYLSVDFRKLDIRLDIDARPRSSVYMTGLLLCNCEGTVDEPYRGEFLVKFYDVVKSLPKYKKGDRIVQIKLGFTLPFEFEDADQVNMNTSRGTGGFGSTGKS